MSRRLLPPLYLLGLITWGLSLAISLPGDVRGEEVVVRPVAVPGPLDNPLKGWAPYTDAGTIRQPYSMVFLYVPWSELEPREGEYRFEEWEQKAWEVPAAQGKHIIFRVFVDYPKRPSGLPEWLRADVNQTKYTDHGGGNSPDYDSPRMRAAMRKFIEALGKRYDQHPRVAFIQLGMLGHWGEWHTWPQASMYANSTTEEQLIRAYRAAFPTKSLMVRYSRDFAGTQDWLGFHDDMFPEDTDNGKDWGFLPKLRKTGRTENWRVAVVGGEMVPRGASRWMGPDFDQTLQMAERAHFTWVGPYGPPLDRTDTAEFRQNSEKLVRRMGYEFRLDEVRHAARVVSGSSTSIQLSGENQGVAPFYYQWPVKVALLGADQRVVASQTVPVDLRTWQPGKFRETFSIRWEAPAGEYKLALGFIDPWTERPTIGLANDLPTHEGWILLSGIKIDAP